MGLFDGMSAAAGSVLSGGLGFLGNLGGSIAGGLFSANQAKINRKFQERMYEKQYKDSVDFWKLQQEYNLPSAQLERLRQANLSPLLLYGEGGISGNLAQQAPQLPQQPHGAQGQVSSFNTRIELANLALVEAQAKAYEAQANRDNASADSQVEYKKQLAFYNGINDDTRAIQIAIKYRDYDFLNQRIDALRNDIFQSSFMNGAQAAYLATMSGLSTLHYHLDAYVRGQQVLQGWKNVEIGERNANSNWLSATAQMKDAITRAGIAPYQIGQMYQNTLKLKLGNDFLEKTLNGRVSAVDLKNKVLTRQAANVSWQNVLLESNVNKAQSEIFLNYLRGNKIQSDMDKQAYDMLMDPASMLLPFGSKW